MPSKRRKYRSNDNESSFSASQSPSSESEYTRRKRKKKKSKDRKSKSKRKHKESKRRKKEKHKKDKKKSKRKHHKDEGNCVEPVHKKRKLNDTNPCATAEMISNAANVINMFCENDDSIKEYLNDIFYRLDNSKSVCISKEDISYQQPLKMIFTFLRLQTDDGIVYKKLDKFISLQLIFKKQLKTKKKSKKKESPKPTIGPSMPPSNYKKTEQLSEIASSGIIGPSMPTKADLENNKYASSDDGEDADLYGPASLSQVGVQNETERKRILAMKEALIYNEMNRKIKEGGSVNGKDNIREEWLTTMPSSFMSDLEKGTKARGFSQNEHKMDSSWMDNPNDLKRQKKERKRIRQIQKEANEQLKALGLPTIQQRENQMDEACDGNEVKQVTERKKSLFEIHQESMMKEYKESLKEWKMKKKMGQKVGPKPVYKGAKKFDGGTGSMESFYNPNNPTLTRSKLNTFVTGGTIEDY